MSYHGSRMRAAVLSTRRLRRVERSYRRQANSGGSRLGTDGLASWVAVRDELRQRGKRVPEASVRPRRWRH